MPQNSLAAFQFGAGLVNSAGAGIRRDAEQKISTGFEDRRLNVAEQQVGLNKNADARAEIASRLGAQEKQELIKRYQFDNAVNQSQKMADDAGMQAINGFANEVKTIDMASPDAVKKYEEITSRYLPTITQSQKARPIYEAIDSRAKQGKQFFDTKIAETGLQALHTWASKNAPDLAAAPPKNPDGNIDWQSYGDEVRGRQKELLQSEIEKRMAPMTARGSMEAKRTSVADRIRLDSQKYRIQKLYDADTMARTDLAGVSDPAMREPIQRKIIEIGKQIRDAERKMEQLGRASEPRPEAARPATANYSNGTLPEIEDARQQAQQAIQNGKDPAGVQAKFRKLYGEDL
jgi:hypothetical protein